MAYVVFIFGAGASVAAGAPLMRTFFARMDRLRGEGRLDAADHDRVTQARWAMSRAASKWHLDATNIESTFLSLDIVRAIGGISGLTSDQAGEATQSLTRLVAKTVEESMRFIRRQTQYSDDPVVVTAGYQWFGVVSTRKPSENGGLRFGAITFNYDIGLEIGIRGRGGRPDYCFSGSLPDAGVPVCKLHGSLNWRRDPESGNLKAIRIDEAFSYIGQTEERVPLRFSDLHNRADKVERSRGPVIVPPVENKSGLRDSVRPVWAAASKLLSQARAIVVVGYSFPSTDQFFRSFLALATISQVELERFVVIDPSIEVTNRFRTMLSKDQEPGFLAINQSFEQSTIDLDALLRGLL